MASRSGASAPPSAACAVTAKISPESSARRFPLAESTSRRLAQPRVMIMPAPNSRPPISAPERLPREASWREVPTSSTPSSVSSWMPTTAEEKVSSHTASFSPKRRCQNSITAERRQNRERCAMKPNAAPISAPPTARTVPSP